jgi:hypothetical protein
MGCYQGSKRSHPVEWMSSYRGPGSYTSSDLRGKVMRKFASIVTLVVVSAALVSAAKKYPLTAASIVPAAKGSVEIGKDRNGNTQVKLKVEHLANPTSLTPSQANYIVWLQDKGSGPENQGELKVNEKLEGTFQTVTPRKNFDVFVTGENDGTVKSRPCSKRPPSPAMKQKGASCWYESRAHRSQGLREAEERGLERAA